MLRIFKAEEAKWDLLIKVRLSNRINYSIKTLNCMNIRKVNYHKALQCLNYLFDERTPYAMIVMIACFGNRSLVTPLTSQLPSFFAKTASCLNPIVFAISHPKYGFLTSLSSFTYSSSILSIKRSFF
jgi:hypothetical protein